MPKEESYLEKMETAVIQQSGLESARKAAFAESNAAPLPGVAGGPKDAYRHILISAEMTRRKGEWVGKAAGMAHEIGNKLGGTQTDMDGNMDDHNNAIGVEIGKGAKTWGDVVTMARDVIINSAAHDGDGKDGRATWHKKTGDPAWRPDWKGAAPAPNAHGGADERYTSPLDWTEDEVKAMHREAVRLGANHPRGRALAEKVRDWHDAVYGDLPVKLDATGRMVMPEKKDSGGGPVSVRSHTRDGGKVHVDAHTRSAP